MEISLITGEEPYEGCKTIDPPLESWEKIGQVALKWSSLVAVSAFVPALFKKKQRIYSAGSPLAPATPMEMETVEIPQSAGPPVSVPRGTPEEQRKVQEILTTTAKGGVTLITQGWHLMKLGEEVDHIHPFSFLLAAPKESMKKIFHEGMGLAKNSVLGGITRGLSREYPRGNLERYIPSFAAAMGKEPAPIQRFIRACDWKGLTRYLFDLRDW